MVSPMVKFVMLAKAKLRFALQGAEDDHGVERVRPGASERERQEEGNIYGEVTP